MLNAKFLNETADAIHRQSRAPRVVTRIFVWVSIAIILPVLVLGTIIALCVSPRRMRRFMRSSNERAAVRQVIGEAQLVRVDSD